MSDHISKHDMQPDRLVDRVSESLRKLVFAKQPDAFVGSLRDLARECGVGTVTFQQAARILEHEGLLRIRRGPGGGYYGARPDEAVVGRSIDAYLRSYPASFNEALNLTSLLFTEVAAAAALCSDPELLGEMETLGRTIDSCNDEAAWNAFESAFQALLFEMVDWPLFSLLSHVTMSVASVNSGGRASWVRDLERWKEGRRRIVAAILRSDPELARFEAHRGNRLLVLKAMNTAST